MQNMNNNTMPTYLSKFSTLNTESRESLSIRDRANGYTLKKSDLWNKISAQNS